MIIIPLNYNKSFWKTHLRKYVVESAIRLQEKLNDKKKLSNGLLDVANTRPILF